MSGPDELREKLFEQLSDVEAMTKELVIREGALPVEAQATIVDDLNEIRHVLTAVAPTGVPTTEAPGCNPPAALDADTDER